MPSWMPEWIKELWQEFVDWLYELALWVPRKIWELVCDGVASVLEAIPIPEWLANVESWFANIDPGVAYLLEPLQLEVGLGIVIGAYVIRFLIRRIPIIG